MVASTPASDMHLSHVDTKLGVAIERNWRRSPSVVFPGLEKRRAQQ